MSDDREGGIAYQRMYFESVEAHSRLVERAKRLEAAGDAMADALFWNNSEWTQEKFDAAREAWEAAKK